MASSLSYSGPAITNFGPKAVGAVWALTGLSTLTVTARVISRVRINRDTGLDDAVMFFAWVITLVSSIMFTVSVAASQKIFDHTHDIESYLPTALKLDLISVSFGIMALFLPKYATALLLVRIFQPRRWVKWTLISASVVGIALGIVGVIVAFVQCNPIPGQWNPAKYHPTCWSPNVQINYSIFTGTFSAFLDFLYASYPATVIRTLQLNRWRKFGISVLMGLGFVSGAVGIYKSSQFTLLSAHSGPLPKLLYATAFLGMLTNVEANLIIATACIPPAMPLLNRVLETSSKCLSYLRSHLSTTTTKKSKISSNGHLEIEFNEQGATPGKLHVSKQTSYVVARHHRGDAESGYTDSSDTV